MTGDTITTSPCGAYPAAMWSGPRPSLVYLLVGGLSWPVLRILYRLKASGTENLPATGGFVLAANHWSNFDPWPLGIPLYPRRFLRFMAKSELFWFPLDRVIRGGGGFEVKRGTRDQAAIDTAVRLCREGNAVVMFPEGTRRAKGLRKKREAEWHSGAARIALEAGVPLVPAAIAGTDRLSRMQRLEVAYGRPLDTDDLDELGPGDAAPLVTERLREAIEILEHSLKPS
jgi:1-acyl-sn-glycerol-3-phosphate acyltransferase